MKNIKQILAAAILLIGLFTACKKDTESPVITLTAPAHNDTLTWGEVIHLEMVFTDNEALKSYRVFLADSEGDPQPEFTFDYRSSLIDGSTFSFHEHDTVPEGVTGAYYLFIKAEDEEGNEASKELTLNFKE